MDRDMVTISGYKFLKTGQLATHGSGVWVPGEPREVPANLPLVACQQGIHYARPPHLSRWISDELWTFEDLSPDETFEHDTPSSKMVTRAGRIIERVTLWNPQTAQTLAFRIADHAVRATLPATLRTVGLHDHATILASLDEITDAQTARAASDAAWAASDAVWAASGGAARAASDAARAASDTARAASDAAWAASDAARAASEAARAASDAARAASDAVWAAIYEHSSRILCDLVGIDLSESLEDRDALNHNKED
jgi:hypothetical protein